jgi:hypothetical protein
LSCPGIRHSSSVHVTPRCRLFSPRHPRHEHGFTSNNSVTIFVQFEPCNRTTLAVLLSLSPSSLSFSPPLKCLPPLLSLLSFLLLYTSPRSVVFYSLLSYALPPILLLEHQFSLHWHLLLLCLSRSRTPQYNHTFIRSNYHPTSTSAWPHLARVNVESRSPINRTQSSTTPNLTTAIAPLFMPTIFG